MFMTHKITQLSKEHRLSEAEFLKRLTKILDKYDYEYKRHDLMQMKSIFIIIKKDTNVYKGIITAGFIFGSSNYFGIDSFTLKGE